MNTALDILASICLISGAALAVVGGIGLVRFPDVLSRLHALAKPQILGVLLVLLGVALHLRSWAHVPTLALTAAFQLATSPVAAHMVARAAYRAHAVRAELLVDEPASRAE